MHTWSATKIIRLFNVGSVFLRKDVLAGIFEGSLQLGSSIVHHKPDALCDQMFALSDQIFLCILEVFFIPRFA